MSELDIFTTSSGRDGKAKPYLTTTIGGATLNVSTNWKQGNVALNRMVTFAELPDLIAALCVIDAAGADAVEAMVAPKPEPKAAKGFAPKGPKGFAPKAPAKLTSDVLVGIEAGTVGDLDGVGEVEVVDSKTGEYKILTPAS